MEEVLQRLLGVLDKLTGERGVPAGDSSVDKNIVKSPNSTLDNGKKVSGNISTNEKKRLKETFSLFNKMFFDYKKKEEPDTKEKAKLSQISKTQATPPKAAGSGTSKSGFGSIVGGLLLLVGGLAAFVTGLMTDGPFKGILKLLSKVGIKGGIELLKKAVKPFISSVGKILKFPLKVLGKIAGFLGKGFSKIGKFVMEGLGKLGGKTMSKVMSKLGSGGFMKMIGGFLGKFAKVFKKIPIVGTLISIAFAYSRFSSGDMVGGTIEVLSGLASLVPGVGTALSIGLDVLNAVLDAKADNGPGKPKSSKLDILKDMASSIGTWIWDRREYIPILAPINRFIMAWDAFKGGNITEGLSHLGWGLASFLTGADAEKTLTAFGAFMGFFEAAPATGKEAPKADSSFLKDISSMVGEKLAALWKWMKDKIIDGIKNFIPGGEKLMEFGKDFVNETKEIAGKAKDRAVEFAKDFATESKVVAGKVWDKVTTVTGGLVDTAKGVLKSAGKNIGDMFKSAKEKIIPKEAPKELDALSLLGKGMMGMMETIEKANPFKPGTTDGAKSQTPANATTPAGKVVGKDAPKDISNILSKTTEDKRDMMEKLYDATRTSNQLLAQIANNTMKGWGGATAGSNTTQTVVTPPMSQPQETPMLTMPSNRGSYRTSPYAI